ncbi:unnamed protein product [Caenorhabditis bovis]|uniref:NADAR domain-containing protein n=1 Tax=Caenorhabditis bovis TaxID=2654633 RepID=A0A8S1E974_9PELO|nr:unnamed protein product [Caenorhabditis bovis]
MATDTVVYISNSPENPSLVLFYSETLFSNFTTSPFKARVHGKEYRFQCSEQYFMFRKAMLINDEESAHQILASNSPAKMKAIGRKLKMSRSDLTKWATVGIAAMREALVGKFTQNERFRLSLFRTRGFELVEASPTDTVWGIGMGTNDVEAIDKANWKGKNQLGILLDDVRDELWRCDEYKKEREIVEKESMAKRASILESETI